MNVNEQIFKRFLFPAVWNIEGYVGQDHSHSLIKRNRECYRPKGGILIWPQHQVLLSVMRA
jgi:hypothetical protein